MLNYANVPAFRETERAEIETMIAETRQRLAGASGRAIGEIVATLGLACRHPRDDGETPKEAKASRSAAAEIMVRYLIGYPLDVLEAAADQWIKTQVFFPAVAELRALCEPELQRRRTAISMMERALEASERKAQEAAQAAKLRAEREDPTKRAAVTRMLAQARKQLGETPRRPPRGPRTIEMTDEQREAALKNVHAGKIGK